MDRDALKAIQNQKVFVPLASVLEVQAAFNHLVTMSKPVVGSAGPMISKERAHGMAQLIKTLGLPIEIPNGF